MYYFSNSAPRQILHLGTDIFESTIKCYHKKPPSEPLHPQQVIKNFPIQNRLVHIEMELYQKGIVNDRHNPKISLKIALAKLIAQQDNYAAATIETAGRLVSIWRQRNIYYLFFSCGVDALGLCAPDSTSAKAAVLRMTSGTNLYRALMLNIPKADESGWFEIRRCDVTLSPLPARLKAATESIKPDQAASSEPTAAKAAKRAKKRTKKNRKTGWIKDFNKNSILIGSEIHVQYNEENHAKSLVGFRFSTLLLCLFNFPIFAEQCSVCRGYCVQYNAVHKSVDN